jgi:uncharacterized protein (TIGR03000 family)
MRRTMKRFAWALATLTLFWSVPRAESAAKEGAQKKPAVIVVLLPAKAELSIGGTKTKQQSQVREFDTPPLLPGKKYSYSVVALWKDGDREERREMTIIVQAGEKKEINLLESKPSAPPVEQIPAPELIPESVKEPDPKPKPSIKKIEAKLESEKNLEPEPVSKATFALLLPETLTLQPGASKLLPIKVARTDCQGPVRIKFEGLPPGMEMKETTIASDKQKVYVLAAAPVEAEEKEWQVKVIGLSGSLREDHCLKIKIAK